MGTLNLLGLLGGFLADAKLGRYLTVALSATITAVGIIFLTLATSIHSMRPPQCDDYRQQHHQCIEANGSQLALLYAALYTTALGGGGIKSNVSGFGSDQFDAADPKEEKAMIFFFNRFYFGISIGSLFAVIVLVYVQVNVSRGLGYGISAGAMIIAVVVFLAGTTFYRFSKPRGSPLTVIWRVIFLAWKKRAHPHPSHPSLLNGCQEAKIPHTERLKCLDKAAILDEYAAHEGNRSNSWIVSTVTQVEEVKLVFKLMPIWSTCILFWTVYSQMTTFTIEQATFMNRKVGSFEIPAGSFSAFLFITILLPQIHAKLISLIELLMQQKKDVSKVVDVLQALYELSVREFPRVKKTMDTLRMEGLAPRRSAADADFLFEKAVNFPDDEDAVFFRHLRRLHTILTSRDSMHNVPMNLEARRRIAFFSNSLFMNMPRAPYVEKMMAFSVLTPYYDEEVLYGKEALRSENEDGISTLFYLQKIYADEWTNFMERMHRQGMENDDEIFQTKARDLRVWASFRGQTLSRTVRGMMYYYRALKMLAFLDTASEMDIRDDGSQQVGSHVLRSQSSGLDGIQSGMTHSSRKLGRTSSSVSYLFKGNEHGIAMLKFTYVVACQVYGQHKAKGDYRAEEILYLMKDNEALRVAYVDEVHLGRDEVEYYSVLVKYDQETQREVEIYRIRLPGPLKLGEGKPENQNHAIIFTRGDAIQTIDMNQDNYFEEALKMRNLLEEFKHFYGIRKPTILGVRENIFTGSVSSLAWFMSAQEMSFVTLNQRVLANPLKVRMHYGHPDVFDRFWFLPRGGISKASKVINISEDIFAGFNCTLRGGNVTHHEYIQVGKGRDVGLNQISMFEAKVASGNGEQVLSRDVYRLGHRLDFFRMLSFFYSTVGFYFNTMMVILTVYSFLWGRLFLSLSGIEKKTSTNKSLGVILNQQFIIQLGLFTALPMIVENSLEQGFLRAVWDFLTMQLQLASAFYTFSMGTRTHFFGRTILHGGAKYRATGRGFVVEHKSFAENYRLYSRSHFVKAIELGIILIVYAAHSSVADTFVYIAMSISSWCLVLSWIMAPFVFNPSGFDWLKTVYDFDDFINWLWYSGGVFTKAEQSWETWWYEEQDHLRTTGLWGKLLEIILDLRFFFFQYGVVYQLKITNENTSIAVYLLSWIYMVVAVGIYIVLAYAQDKYAAKDHIHYRLVQLTVIIALVLVAVLLIEFTKISFLDFISSLLAFIPTGYGIILIAQVLRPFLQSTVVWDTIVSLARLYDLIFGVIVMAPVALLSWLPGFQSMQTRILFNEAFSRGLQISRILSGKKSQ